MALLLTLGKSDKFAWGEFEQPIRLARRAKTREGFRNEKYLALGDETPIQITVALATPSANYVTSDSKLDFYIINFHKTGDQYATR